MVQFSLHCIFAWIGCIQVFMSWYWRADHILPVCRIFYLIFQKMLKFELNCGQVTDVQVNNCNLSNLIASQFDTFSLLIWIFIGQFPPPLQQHDLPCLALPGLRNVNKTPLTSVTRDQLLGFPVKRFKWSQISSKKTSSPPLTWLNISFRSEENTAHH